MRLISVEPIKKRLPRLLCLHCIEKRATVRAYGEENGVPVNLVLCHDCLDLARDGYIRVLKRNRLAPTSAARLK